MKDLVLYHGSQKVIMKPQYGYGKSYNDYGMAFYCTEICEMAREWACTETLDGFSNQYRLKGQGLNELNLCGEDYHILNWLAVLLANRTFRVESDLQITAKKYILDNFLPNYRDYDVIKGYRADDSYFSFANAFLNNSLSLEQLGKAMYLGQLGEQIAIVSKKAFLRLEFVDAEPVAKEVYYPKKVKRDQEARRLYRDERDKVYEGTYMIDLIREKWRNEDERLQHIVY